MRAPERLRHFGGGRAVHEQELADEMAWHIARLAEELEQGGMAPEEAQAEAARRFGDPAAYRRACHSIAARDRAIRRLRMRLEGLGSDLTAAVRGVRARPIYAATVVLTLALAIGMSTTVFSVVDTVMLTPLDLPSPDRLVSVRETERETGAFNSVTPANFVDWRAQSESFSGMAAIEPLQPTLGDDHEPRRVRAAAVTEDFFSVIGLSPSIGRLFDQDELSRVDSRVAILSNTFYRRQFGRDPAILDTPIELDGEKVQVVGVMPAGVDVPLETDLWLPLVFDFDVADARGAHYLSVIGRLADGVDRASALAELDAIARRLEAAYPNTNTNSAIALTPLKEFQIASVRPLLVVLIAAVAVILLIACANIAGLALARALGREQEMALRTALGARRGRLTRQLLAEASFLALAGGAGGLLLAWLALSLFATRLPFDLPRIEEAGIDTRTLVFTWLVSVLCTLLFGLAPTFRLARVSVDRILRDRSAAVLGAGRRLRLRQGLVAIELALALILLSAFGLLLRSLSALSDVDLGFEPAGILTLKLDLPESRYPDEQSVAFYERLLTRLEALPGAQSAAVAPWLPLTPGWSFSFQIVGDPPAPPEARQRANLRMVGGDYFGTLQIRHLAGRLFDRRDHATSPPVILVNQALIDRYFQGRDPLDHELELGYGRNDGPKAQRRIVGVVGDVHHFGPAGPALPTVYAPQTQIPFDDMAVALRAQGDPLDLAAAARKLVRELDPALAVDELKTLEERYSDVLAVRRFVPALLGVFAALALSLASLGLYAVLSQLVAARTPELGVRRALGASASSIAWLVLGRALSLVSLGIAAGLIGAWGSTRLVQRLLFGVEPGDPATLLAVAVLLTAVAVIACIVPAMRALRVDPVHTLRQL